MVKELKSLRNFESFKMITHPRSVNILQPTWSFKIKRYLDGGLNKYTARLCAHGDQQIYGLDDFEMYAPVVYWITFYLLLILGLKLSRLIAPTPFVRAH